MGYFDVQSQRRTEVIDSAVIIPAAEVSRGRRRNGAAGRKAAGAAEKACKTEEVRIRSWKKHCAAIFENLKTWDICRPTTDI